MTEKPPKTITYWDGQEQQRREARSYGYQAALDGKKKSANPGGAYHQCWDEGWQLAADAMASFRK